MERKDVKRLEREFYELSSAINATRTLKEEFEHRLDEARDDSVR